MTTTLKVQNGDVVRDVNGRHDHIEGTEKVRQGIRAILSLAKPAGAGIMDALAPDGEEEIAVVVDLRRTIRKAVEDYALALRSTQRTARSPTEQIREIKSIVVNTLPEKTAFGFRVEVTAGDGTPVVVSGRRVFA